MSPRGIRSPARGGLDLHERLALINKTDLAPHVGADLEVMRQDSQRMRGDRPFYLVSIRHGDGMEDVLRWVREQFASRPKTS